MDMETLGYFVYMDKCEREEDQKKLQLLKVNVETEADLVPEGATTEENGSN